MEQSTITFRRAADFLPEPTALVPEFIPDLDRYDRILVGFSGGRDSLALVLRLLDLGVDRRRIELHHHDIDGDGPSYMDWAITPAYCRAVAAALGIPIYFSYRQGGFRAEMLKTDERSLPIRFEDDDGSIGQAGGLRGKIETRRKFPQQTANLAVRWCSASLKIDVFDAVIRNSLRFKGKRLLILTGERAAESPNRARYKVFGPHRSHAACRPADHWLAVHAWSDIQVWSIIERYGIVPHPAYRLGWSRLSCLTCIFGSPSQWATIRHVFPERFRAVADHEAEFGVTIRRGMTLDQLADRGTPYAAAIAQPELVAFASQGAWTGPITTADWTMPAGAFAEAAGPS